MASFRENLGLVCLTAVRDDKSANWESDMQSTIKSSSPMYIVDLDCLQTGCTSCHKTVSVKALKAICYLEVIYIWTDLLRLFEKTLVWFFKLQYSM